MKYSCFTIPDESRQCLWAPQSSAADFKPQLTGHCPQTEFQQATSVLYELTKSNFDTLQLYMQRKERSLISETHTEVSFIAYDLHVSCSRPWAPR